MRTQGNATRIDGPRHLGEGDSRKASGVTAGETAFVGVAQLVEH